MIKEKDIGEKVVVAFFFERKCGRGSPYSDFVFFLNKNPNSYLWRLEPGWLGYTSTFLTK
jgi:hypothetical protein